MIIDIKNLMVILLRESSMTDLQHTVRKKSSSPKKMEAIPANTQEVLQTSRLLSDVLDKLREGESGAEADSERSDSLQVNLPSSVLSDTEAPPKPQRKCYLAIFHDFSKPDSFFDSLDIEVRRAPKSTLPRSDEEKRIFETNIKLFYSPPDANCSDLVTQLESLGCKKTAIGWESPQGLVPFKDRIIFELQK